MSKRALVTGASGFIGRHLSKALTEAGATVVGIGRSAWDQADRERCGVAEWHACGVSPATLAAHARGVDEIYHCAGSGSVSLSLTAPRQDFDCNVGSVMDILEFARESPGIRVVILSSAAVYGAVPKGPIRVETGFNPISPYGVNKTMAEMLCRSYARSFSVPLAIVRLFSVYGEGLRKQLLWDASNKLLRGDLAFWGTGEETRDWIHADDAARLLIAAAKLADTTAPTLNGATGIAITIHDIVEELASHLGVDRPITFLGTTRPGDPQHYQADIGEALATGWRPQVPLSTGLARYVQWLRDESAHHAAG